MLEGAASTAAVNPIEAIGAHAACRTVDLVCLADGDAPLGIGVVLGSVRALLAPVVDEDEARVAEASPVPVFAVGVADGPALAGLEVVQGAFRALAAHSPDWVETVYADAGTTFVLLVHSASCNTFSLWAQCLALLALDGHTPALAGLVPSGTRGLADAIEQYGIAIAGTAVDHR